jgi:hypothetical protein
MAWFSYPDGMDHEETQRLTPISSDSPWLERCGTLLRPQNDPALFGQAMQICTSLQMVNHVST